MGGIDLGLVHLIGFLWLLGAYCFGMVILDGFARHEEKFGVLDRLMGCLFCLCFWPLGAMLLTLLLCLPSCGEEE